MKNSLDKLFIDLQTKLRNNKLLNIGS